MHLFGKKEPATAEKIKEKILKSAIITFNKYNIEKVVFIDSKTNEKLNGSPEVAVLITPLKKEEFWIFRQELSEGVGHPVDVYSQDDKPELINMIQEQGEIIFEEDRQ